MERYGNWIGGEERASKQGLFELRARAGDAGLLGEWPRSGAAEVEQVWALLAPGAALGRTALAEALAPSAAGAAGFAARLGLRLDEAESFLASRPRGGFGLGLERGGAAGRVLVVASPTTLADELVRLAATPLAAGRAVLIVAHENLPMAADRARERLVAGGLAPDRLAVLHGLTSAGWRALGELEPKLDVLGELDLGAHLDLEGSARTSPGLGRLLLRLGSTRESRFDLPAFARREALVDAPVEILAERLVARAFGRSFSLGGQVSGAPLACAIPERSYAAFVDAVLEALERLVATEAPMVWSGGSALVRRYKEGWRRALDEGAVMLQGGEVMSAATGFVLAPTLLVNLQLTGRSFVPTEPLAQLRLARAPKHS